MSEIETIGLVVLALTSIGGLVTAVTTYRSVNSDVTKSDAETDSIAVDTMETVLARARQELERAETATRSANTELARAREALDRCHRERSEVLRRLTDAEIRIALLGAYLERNHGVDPNEINGDRDPLG